MPFVQRVVQPTRLALASAIDERARSAKFHCMPCKCQNNNCINKQTTTQIKQQQQHVNGENEHVRKDDVVCIESSSSGGGGASDTNSRTIANAKDISQQQQQHSRSLAATPTAGMNHTPTTTVTRAIIHVSQQNGGGGGDATSTLGYTTNKLAASAPTTPLRDVRDDFSHHHQLQHQHNLLHHNHNYHNHTNGGYTCSFTYATDTEEEISIASTSTPAAPPVLSLKKLKHHVEFLSTAPSPTRSACAGDILGHQQQHHHQHQQRQHLQRQRQQQQLQLKRAQSPTAAKIVSGHEFESISNLTLSNALRQLASLVLLASDIFEELQSELLSVGERARNVQRKVIAVEQRVTAYDPKMVTVPESDLLTFAQRKTHFLCDKSIRKELFTASTRPPSVRVLYEEAAIVRPTAYSLAYPSPHSPRSFTSADGLVVCNADGTTAADGALLDGVALDTCDDELVCTPVFGKTNRKMHTRIDAEIEIRLPAAIEDLRKWTSSEALGDVTVTPDCMHHVDTSISTSMVIGDNGVLTPALSPSVLSADAVDALYAINVSQIGDNTQLPNDINKDVPLNHRLPSPEEQCKIIALRYPAEVISVDTSGKRFQRMCAARKSTTGCYTGNMAETNNLNDDVQTVSRRSRSRRVRGKRRNTIAGTDQKEIQDAANGDSTATSGEIKNALGTAAATKTNSADDGAEEDARRGDKSKKFGRSKSSDILKKDAVALPYDKGKNTLTRLNSLKQWGRNRFKFMQRTEATAPTTSSDSGAHDMTTTSSSSNSSQQRESAVGERITETSNSNNGATTSSGTTKTNQTTRSNATTTGDIDDECVVHELVSQKNEGRFSHERKPSYSSSEKSMSVSSGGHLKGKLHLATCGNVVKLRDTSSLNRQRRIGITDNGALSGGKEEQPHSSSGNWSASSESGRASIGSEITIQPKSSASNTSLNVSSFHPGSGPPSSMMSRRRFLNTSASSSVTSEGTATPDLQVADGSYPNHLDDETSSAYSCDTEGYYTSFHMDSGLRTLKEEDPPMTPLQHNQMLHTSNYSFGNQSNQTVLTAENEYELFGKGSTSTTTSSAGTVCTTLLVSGEQSSLNSGVGPDVPERISSLGKLNKNNHSNSESTSTLERSYSSSTIGSTVERTGTIKRNLNAAALKLNTTNGGCGNEDIDGVKGSFETPESQEDEFDFEKRIRRRSAQPLPAMLAMSEVDVSESSDLEGVERIERIKQKTAINVKRIPSMCIITPTTSDDENQSKDGCGDNDVDDDEAYDPDRTLTPQSSPCSTKAMCSAETTLKVEGNEVTSYCTVSVDEASKVAEPPLTPTKAASKDHNLNVLKRNSNYAMNMFEKLKVALPSIKRSPTKSLQQHVVEDDDELYDTAGEYVTIADISNNNRHNQLPTPKAVGASCLGIYYSNDIVRRKLDIAAPVSTSGNATTATKKESTTSASATRRREAPTSSTTEYVSLNELPQHLRKVGDSIYSSSVALSSTANNEITAHDVVSTQETVDNKTGANCAESTQQSKKAFAVHVETTAVPMYAEISEVREQQSLVSPQALQNKGARVRLNSQGKIIYDSDSLKRRKGAHTTFAPGPYVKETESALGSSAEITSARAPTTDVERSVVQQVQAQTQTQSQLCSESVNITKANNSLLSKTTTLPTTTAAKLLVLNGGVAATRKIANVRPIVAASPLTLARQQQREQQQQQSLQQQHFRVGHSTNSPTNMSLSSGLYEEPHTVAQMVSSYQDNKNLLANNTTPFFQTQNIITAATPLAATAAKPALLMMPSPSAKSTSSTGSTISSSASTNTSTSGTSSASSNKEEEISGDGNINQYLI
ncbi:uncharacterized protein gukh isoform X2 [Eurosta solidaginis]|uniref:uncharacterized protein gukh isoform X2 n=1 Tax=Eurosta solidaginis TaxID=178769 RepID=UPI003530E57D